MWGTKEMRQGRICNGLSHLKDRMAITSPLQDQRLPNKNLIRLRWRVNSNEHLPWEKEPLELEQWQLSKYSMGSVLKTPARTSTPMCLWVLINWTWPRRIQAKMQLVRTLQVFKKSSNRIVSMSQERISKVYTNLRTRTSLRVDLE